MVKGEADAQALSDCYHHAPATFSGVPHKGTLPLSGSVLLLDNENISLSTLRVTAESNLILRVYHRTDAEQSALITLPRTIEAAFLTDITEKKNAPINTEGENAVRITVGARATQTLRIVLE